MSPTPAGDSPAAPAPFDITVGPSSPHQHLPPRRFSQRTESPPPAPLDQMVLQDASSGAPAQPDESPFKSGSFKSTNAPLHIDPVDANCAASPDPVPSCDAKLQVGIIGAGMSGMYAALLLKDMAGDESIKRLCRLPDGGIAVTIFEAGEKIGGRIGTEHFDNNTPECSTQYPGGDAWDYVEMGAMRIPRTRVMKRVIGSGYLGPNTDPEMPAGHEDHEDKFSLVRRLNENLPEGIPPITLGRYDLNGANQRTMYNGKVVVQRAAYPVPGTPEEKFYDPFGSSRKNGGRVPDMFFDHGFWRALAKRKMKADDLMRAAIDQMSVCDILTQMTLQEYVAPFFESHSKADWDHAVQRLLTFDHLTVCCAIGETARLAYETEWRPHQEKPRLCLADVQAWHADASGLGGFALVEVAMQMVNFAVDAGFGVKRDRKLYAGDPNKDKRDSGWRLFNHGMTELTRGFYQVLSRPEFATEFRLEARVKRITAKRDGSVEVSLVEDTWESRQSISNSRRTSLSAYRTPKHRRSSIASCGSEGISPTRPTGSGHFSNHPSNNFDSTSDSFGSEHMLRQRTPSVVFSAALPNDSVVSMPDGVVDMARVPSACGGGDSIGLVPGNESVGSVAELAVAEANRTASEASFAFDHVVMTPLPGAWNGVSFTTERRISAKDAASGISATNALSAAKRRGLRHVTVRWSTKIGVKFLCRWWADPAIVGHGNTVHGGILSTDGLPRNIVLPSYPGQPFPDAATDAERAANDAFNQQQPGVMLLAYCWAQDAGRISALPETIAVDQCLRDLARMFRPGDAEVVVSDGKVSAGRRQTHGGLLLYPTEEEFFRFLKRQLHPHRFFARWSHDDLHQGAFPGFSAHEFGPCIDDLLTPELDGQLHTAGETASLHHGWVVGALNSAYRAVYRILVARAKAPEERAQILAALEKRWGTISSFELFGSAGLPEELKEE